MSQKLLNALLAVRKLAAKSSSEPEALLKKIEQICGFALQGEPTPADDVVPEQLLEQARLATAKAPVLVPRLGEPWPGGPIGFQLDVQVGPAGWEGSFRILGPASDSDHVAGDEERA